MSRPRNVDKAFDEAFERLLSTSSSSRAAQTSSSANSLSNNSRTPPKGILKRSAPIDERDRFDEAGLRKPIKLDAENRLLQKQAAQLAPQSAPRSQYGDAKHGSASRPLSQASHNASGNKITTHYVRPSSEVPVRNIEPKSRLAHPALDALSRRAQSQSRKGKERARQEVYSDHDDNDEGQTSSGNRSMPIAPKHFYASTAKATSRKSSSHYYEPEADSAGSFMSTPVDWSQQQVYAAPQMAGASMPAFTTTTAFAPQTYIQQQGMPIFANNSMQPTSSSLLWIPGQGAMHPFYQPSPLPATAYQSFATPQMFPNLGQWSGSGSYSHGTMQQPGYASSPDRAFKTPRFVEEVDEDVEDFEDPPAMKQRPDASSKDQKRSSGSPQWLAALSSVRKLPSSSRFMASGHLGHASSTLQHAQLKPKPKRKPSKPLLDEFGNIVKRRPGRPRTRPLPPEKDGADKYMLVKAQRGDASTSAPLTSKGEASRQLDICRPLYIESKPPGRFETHTLFVLHAARLAALARSVEQNMQQNAGPQAQLTEARAVRTWPPWSSWARWTWRVDVPRQESEPDTGPAKDGVAPGPTAADACSIDDLFPLERLRAYQASQEADFANRRTPKPRVSLARLATYLYKHASDARGEDNTSAPRHRLKKLIRKAVIRRRAADLDVRRLWSFWAKKAHEARFEAARNRTRGPLTRTVSFGDPPDLADAAAGEGGASSPTLRFQVKAEPESPSKGLRSPVRQQTVASTTLTDVDSEQLEPVRHQPPSRKHHNLPYLRRNLRIYSQLGIELPK
ncbi:hypothetical protein BCV70DRAFT_205187 [Testicularia cyperi]|uniref:Uncharacterized protein n=1 Tax=Testicularia cyperi TaxID=1882483 RepID=A0A317XVL4_9BASI|nr:hypothetical protein BCV70DRAFT_205187 [Testicularia cyperi]